MPQTTRRQRLYRGYCLKVLRDLPAASVDACVTDPPYHLVQLSRNGSAQPGDLETPFGRSGPSKARGGFMGKGWDGGDVAFRPETWREVFRVLKPGAHLLAFGGTRTYHRLACAIEDAGFEIRDCIFWCFGSGFPKSHNVALAIDKVKGAAANRGKSFNMKGGGDRSDEFTENGRTFVGQHAPVSNEAAQWAGYGTALKPACEPIVLARKPLIGTVAENVLAHGTGAINVDGCRIAGVKPKMQAIDSDARNNPILHTRSATGTGEMTTEGRWPANLIHDGSAEVVEAFPDAPGQQAAVLGNEPSECHSGVYSGPRNRQPFDKRNDSRSAARFFYCAKASRADRNVGGVDNKHPTVKPTTLMRYLCRLVTPPNGVILDPFMGSGSTGRAAKLEGFRFIGIEREQEYMRLARRRIAA